MNGFLNIDKPEGITSHKAVSSVKKWLRVFKVGHLGTLDPMATGVLLVAVGGATKAAPFLFDLPKVYRGEMTLGIQTDTQDRTGQTIDTRPVEGISLERVENAFRKFTGTIFQEPPMFSAKKVNGQRLYKLARKGESVERKPVPVQVHRLEVLGFVSDRIQFETEVSSGTYIRTLCRDIGNELGVGAHLSQLTRTAVGPFSISDSLRLDSLKDASPGEIEKSLISIGTALSFLPEVRLEGRDELRFRNGNPISPNGVEMNRTEMGIGTRIRVANADGELVGIAEIRERSGSPDYPVRVFQPIRILTPQSD
jgi:tRNA pseudouridine55 synthase